MHWIIVVMMHIYFSSTNFINKANEGGFISKMKASGRNIVVFYGSQTGTAEEFAGRLAKEATRWGLKVF